MIVEVHTVRRSRRALAAAALAAAGFAALMTPADGVRAETPKDVPVPQRGA